MLGSLIEMACELQTQGFWDKNKPRRPADEDHPEGLHLENNRWVM